MPESTLRLPTRSPDATGGQRRSRRGRNSLIAALTAVGLVGLGVVGAWAWWNGSVGSVPIREHCTAHVAATASNPIRIAEFDPEQAGNAAIIAAVAGERGMPARAVSIGIATAIQESKLRNINYGDRDSLGLFQQRPSQGWGTRKQITDPVYASNAFYDVLAKVDGYETMEITKVAQKVQRSAFPDAYADHEPEARVFASALSGNSPAGLNCVLRPSGATAETVTDSGLTPRARAVSTAAKRETGRKNVEPVGTGGRTLKFTVPNSTDDRNAWALAHWAVARAGELTVIRIDIGEKRWDRAKSTDGWTPLSTPLAANTIQITVA